jgi:hypothetical protein
MQEIQVELESDLYTSNFPLRNLKPRIQATRNTIHHRAL